MPVRSAVIMALLCLFITVPALADNGYNPGFRTLGFWQQESGIRVDVNVWYPSVRAPRSLSYAPWTIRGARNGKPVPGRFPLILLSHPSSGTRFSFHDTAAALAARGFVVAAPTHPRDCMENMDHLFLWEQLKDRALGPPCCWAAPCPTAPAGWTTAARPPRTMPTAMISPGPAWTACAAISRWIRAA